LTVASGLSQAIGHLEGTFRAFLGLEWRYIIPIYIGDTVHEEQKVLSRRETQDPSRGIIVVECKLVNQKGEVVQEGKRTIMVARRGTED
jgi:acyl dehydratase